MSIETWVPLEKTEALNRRWYDLWMRLKLDPPPSGIFSAMLLRYCEPQRHYHTLQHLTECFEWLDQVKNVWNQTEAIEFAIWFHDLIYDTHEKTNEAESALIAREILLKSGVNLDFIDDVTDMILFTITHFPLDKMAAQIFLDIDLSILGSSPERFVEYEAQIRREYGWVEEQRYRNERKKIMESFLSRRFIYGVPFFHSRLEDQARKNISNLIDTL